MQNARPAARSRCREPARGADRQVRDASQPFVDRHSGVVLASVKMSSSEVATVRLDLLEIQHAVR